MANLQDNKELCRSFSNAFKKWRRSVIKRVFTSPDLRGESNMLKRDIVVIILQYEFDCAIKQSFYGRSPW